jgi:hypothetical protein
MHEEMIKYYKELSERLINLKEDDNKRNRKFNKWFNEAKNSGNNHHNIMVGRFAGITDLITESARYITNNQKMNFNIMKNDITNIRDCNVNNLMELKKLMKGLSDEIEKLFKRNKVIWNGKLNAIVEKTNDINTKY